MDTIFFDEAGNTGPNIIDKNQPMFTLASILISEADAEQLVKSIKNNAHEIHFKNLRKRPSGKDKIIQIMKNPIVNNSNVSVLLIHKKYMIITKIVDLLIENYLYQFSDIDLYKNGGNICMANLLYCTLPNFFNSDDLELIYVYFIDMIRKRQPTDIESFYTHIEKLYQQSINDDINPFIFLILGSKRIIEHILDKNDKYCLDPSIPSLVALCYFWNKSLPLGFKIIHDDSEAILKHKDMIKSFMDLSQPEVSLGYDRRKITLPLRVKEFKFGDSAKHVQLQVADIIASSVNYWANCINNNERDDDLFIRLDELNLGQYLSPHSVWPSDAVTPEENNTKYSGGNNLIEGVSTFLEHAKIKK